MRHARGPTKLRVMFGPEIAIGPGKADLLEAIAVTGSISAAAKRLGMSYRRTWLLVDTMNRCFREAVVASATGGSGGGGAQVTAFGRRVLASYRAMQSRVDRALDPELERFSELLEVARRCIRRYITACDAFAALLFALALAPCARADNVIVFAAASLKEALDAAVHSFESSSGDKVTVSYAGSNALARQIESGAPGGPLHLGRYGLDRLRRRPQPRGTGLAQRRSWPTTSC